MPAMPPHACCSPFRHSPSYSTETPAPAAVHALAYVFPSHPQTGRNSRVQMTGLVLHIPCASGILHLPGPKSQYCFASGHAAPAMPPQASGISASIGLHRSASSTLRKVPVLGRISRNWLTKRVKLCGVELKPASAHAINPPSIGIGPPTLGL